MILHIEMSIVNLNIIFVKKQKQTRERPTQGRNATLIITEMAVFTLEKDCSCEKGYPFDDSRHNITYITYMFIQTHNDHMNLKGRV